MPAQMAASARNTRMTGGVPTDGITAPHDDKVNDLKSSEAFAGEANTLGHVRKQAQTSHGVGDHSHFPKPCRHRKDRRSIGLKSHRGRIVRTHALSCLCLSCSISRN